MSKRSFYVILTLTVGFLFIFGDAFFLCAQETATEEFTLEEITVTAQKRAENQQKVPITMTTISGEDLAVAGRNNVDDILRTLANVTINTMEDGMRISIRGITDSEDVAMGTSFKVSGSMVGVNIDGAQNNMGNAGQNLFDLERVEVLYGPQSTLYGSNSPGGIVNVVTAAPKTDRYSASIGANYGSFNYLNLQATLNAPVIQDKIALRLAVNKTKQDAYVEGATGTKNTSVRLKALWQATDDLSITLTPNWSKNGNGGFMSGNVRPFGYQDGRYADGTKITNPWTAAPATGGPQDTRPGGDETTKGLNANIEWNTPVGNFALVPSYSKSSSTATETDMEGYVYNSTMSRVQKQAELRVTNPENFTLFQWILGGTYNIWNQGMTRDYEDPNTTDSSFFADSTKKALYANVTYPLPFYEKLALTGGYRQSWDESHSLSQGFPGKANPERTGTYSKPDLKYGFNWDATEQVMVYGSYANSYRSINAQSGGSEPEKLTAYTLGEKARFFNNKLQVNGSVYKYDYKNKEERTEEDFGYFDEHIWGDLDGDNIIEDSVYITSRGFPMQGDFKSFGQDISLTWIITNQDRLDLSISHLDAEWSNLVKPASETYPELWPSVSFKGTENYNSPEWSMTAAYERNFTLGSWGMLTPSIDMQYKSETNLKFDAGQVDPLGYSYQESYTLWNASVTFNSSSGKWSANASVKNIFDYAVKRSYIARGQSVVLMLGEPRIIQVGLNVKF
jgi:iron complex outermembrane recepter protein